MSRLILVALILVALVSTASAQTGWVAQKPQVFASVEPIVIRYKTAFHQDQWNPGLQKTTVQVSAVGLLPDIGLVKWTLAPGLNTEETFIPTQYLKVADAEWNSSTGSSSTSSNKPVTLSLSSATFNRVSVEAFTRAPFRLAAVIEPVRFTVAAQGESNGKQVNVWESFDRTFYGVGAVYDLQPVSVKAIIGPDYRFVEASIFQRVASWATLGASYQYRQYSFSSGLTVRGDGFGVWVEGRF
jgi:hypothetical protein